MGVGFYFSSALYATTGHIHTHIHTRWRGPMRTHAHGTHGWTTRVYSLKRSSFFRFPHAIMFLINTRRYLLQNKRSCMSGGHSSQTCLHDSLFCSSSSTTSFYTVRRFVQFGRMSRRLLVVRTLKKPFSNRHYADPKFQGRNTNNFNVPGQYPT